MDELSNNLRRLLGVHVMRSTRDSRLIDGLSPQALSELQSGSRKPSLQTVEKLSSFFEISLDRLLKAPFEELLARELADPDRFRRVESKKAASSKKSRRL